MVNGMYDEGNRSQSCYRGQPLLGERSQYNRRSCDGKSRSLDKHIDSGTWDHNAGQRLPNENIHGADQSLLVSRRPFLLLL